MYSFRFSSDNIIRQLGVPLCCLDRRVPKDLLQRRQVSPGLDEPAGIGVAKLVHVESCDAGALPDHPRN